MSWTHGVAVARPDGERHGDSKFTWVSPGYFQTVQLPLLEGRDVDEHDTIASTRVVVVNETFVRRYLDRKTAIGSRIRTGAEPGYPSTEFAVVGIVRDAKYGGLRDEIPASAFVPASQHPSPQPWTMLAIRSTAPLSVLRPALARAYRESGVTSDTVIWSLRDQIRDSLLRERLVSWLSGAFGILAGLLAAVGLYGVMAYAVARRANEIAIRIALGASRNTILGLMLGQACRLLLIGLVVGTGAALLAGRSARSLLFGLEPYDLTTFAIAAVALAAVGLTAAYVPAERAARVSPLDGLRAE
jgi:putative ABC transport system permease protein